MLYGFVHILKNKDIDSLGNAVVDEFAQIQTR